MTRWAVWSDADGFVTDPMDDYAEAEAALESMVTHLIVDDDEFDDNEDIDKVVAVEQILVVLPICQHMRIETECERCKA